MRQVYHEDAIKWLNKQGDQSLSHIVCSIPDASELNLPLHQYPSYFSNTVGLLSRKLSARGYMILLQTDRK